MNRRFAGRQRRWKGLVAGAVTALLAFGVPTAHASMPGENGKIAYVSTSPCCSIHTVTPSPDPLQRNDTNLTADQYAAYAPAWSPDGTKIAYLVRAAAGDLLRVWVMNEDGSGKALLSPPSPAWDDASPTWSPDGKKIAFARQGGCCDGSEPYYVWVMDSDGANAHYLIVNQLPVETTYGHVDWSPAGSRLALTGAVVNADGTNRVPIPARDPNWSPSENWLIYDAGTIQRVTPDGAHQGPPQEPGANPVWSPDGRYLALERGYPSYIFVRPEGTEAPGGVPSSGFVVANNGGSPDWQPRPPFVTPTAGYPRPRGAGPLDVPLVPAYSPCRAPNSTHGPPLVFGSCTPPVQTSLTLTTGTPDANGQAARFYGRARLTPIVGGPSTPADVRLSIYLTDVRCQTGGTPPGCSGPLAPYNGSLRGYFDVTITDKNNGGSSVESATGKMLPYSQPALPVGVPCAPTADTLVGSTCAVDTTANAIVGNAVSQGKRSIWAIGQIQVWGVNSDDNTPFAVEGVFVP